MNDMRMKKSTHMLTTLMAAILVTSAHAFIPNGSFELNNPANNSSFSGDVADGWMNIGESGSDPDIYDNSGADGLPPGFNGYMPHVGALDGSNWAGLIHQPGFNYVEAIGSPRVSLSPGDYILRLSLIYDVHNPGGLTDRAALAVSLDRDGGGYNPIAIIQRNTGPDQWEQRQTLITIDIPGQYSLGFAPQAAAGSAYIGIDDMQLNPVPEPTTLAALSIGAAAVLRRWRKK